MAPRPRTVSDEDIVAATVRVMSRLGPVRLTLAEVGKEAGLSAATLVQRFGSKRALLLTISAGAAESADACFDMVRKAQPDSPLAALMDAGAAMARSTSNANELANSLAFLQIDLTDPDFYRHTHEIVRKNVAGYRALLDEAIAAGELEKCDTRRLAHAVNAIAGGSLINWAIFREGHAEKWVRRDLDTLLRPFQPKRSKANRGRRR